MAKLLSISSTVEKAKDWKDTPLMQKFMARDRERAARVIADFEKKAYKIKKAAAVTAAQRKKVN